MITGVLIPQTVKLQNRTLQKCHFHFSAKVIYEVGFLFPKLLSERYVLIQKIEEKWEVIDEVQFWSFFRICLPISLVSKNFIFLQIMMRAINIFPISPKTRKSKSFLRLYNHFSKKVGFLGISTCTFWSKNNPLAHTIFFLLHNLKDPRIISWNLWLSSLNHPVYSNI